MNELSNADAGAASPGADAPGGLAGGGYAQRILPTLQRIRSARQQAEALLAEASANPARPAVAACAAFARASVVACDQPLRVAGLYDLAQAELLDKDAHRMAQAGQLIDATRLALRRLASELRQRAEEDTVCSDAALAELIATLDAPV